MFLLLRRASSREIKTCSRSISICDRRFESGFRSWKNGELRDLQPGLQSAHKPGKGLFKIIKTAHGKREEIVFLSFIDFFYMLIKKNYRLWKRIHFGREFTLCAPFTCGKCTVVQRRHTECSSDNDGVYS